MQKRVYLTGSFNNWDETNLLMNKTRTGWELPVYLAEGTHTYRFIADRRWIADRLILITILMNSANSIP